MLPQIDPEGGCPGDRRVGRICSLCLACARYPVGGEQVQGRVYRRDDGVHDCVLWVSHERTVRLIPVGAHPTHLGGASVESPADQGVRS